MLLGTGLQEGGCAVLSHVQVHNVSMARHTGAPGCMCFSLFTQAEAIAQSAVYAAHHAVSIAAVCGQTTVLACTSEYSQE